MAKDDKNQVKDFRSLLKRNDAGLYNRIICGNGFELSVQAGEYHYSTPRIDNAGRENYTAWEIAIFENDEWVVPINDKRFTSIAEHFDTSGITAVAAYVPTANVQEIYEMLAAWVQNE